MKTHVKIASTFSMHNNVASNFYYDFLKFSRKRPCERFPCCIRLERSMLYGGKFKP